MQTDLSNEEANDLADEILRDADFIGASEPGFFERSLNRVFEFIVEDIIGRIFEAIFGGAGAGAGSLVAYLLLGVVAVLLLIAIVRAIRTGRISSADEDEPRARIVFEEEVDPTQLRRDLAAYRAAGDWRGAVIAGFRLAVIQMIDDGTLAERPGATTGDFGRAVLVTRPELAQVYSDASHAFERAFYSDSTIIAADHEMVANLLTRTQPLVPS